MRVSNCPNCGSSRLRADRALSGRIVCMNCGRPVGAISYRNNFSPATTIFSNKITRFFIIIFSAFFVFIIISNF